MPGKETTESVVIEKKPNKSRLAFLLRYLMDNTDEDHALSIYEIILMRVVERILRFYIIVM